MALFVRIKLSEHQSSEYFEAKYLASKNLAAKIASVIFRLQCQSMSVSFLATGES
jgi:hypothetical protein